MIKPFGLVLGLALPLLAGAEPPASVQQEVKHLLAYIEGSGCEFFRDGTWSNSRTAQARVRSRYDSLVRQDSILTTKDFIDKAASESSVSGKPSQVRCGIQPPILSDLWLGNELSRYQSLRK